MNEPRYLVSVRLMTFNHAEYISDAMHGILMQQTNFDVEVVVGDDFSTDHTLDIVKSYANTKRIHINILNREIGDAYWKERQRLGRLYNFTNILENCSGKYIALLDGDDYWTDPFKLQKQVDVLEKDDNIVICHHWHKHGIYENNRFSIVEAPKKNHGYYPKTIATVRDIFKNVLRIKSRTIMVRNIFNKNFFPEWYYNMSFGDVPLTFLAGQYGNFYFINEEMAIYRQTKKGESTKGQDVLTKGLWLAKHNYEWIKIWDQADKLYDFNYQEETAGTIKFFYKSNIMKNYYSLHMVFGSLWHCLFIRRNKIVNKIKVAFFIVKYSAFHLIKK